MAYDNQYLFKYIDERARYNVENKVFFRNTDILKVAFGVSEEKAYEIIKYIMASGKSIPNTKESLIDEYMNMLANGYIPLSEQYSMMGGDKLASIKREAERKYKNFTKGSIFDIFKEIFNIEDKDIPHVLIKYAQTIESDEFLFKMDKENFYKFLENDMDELDKQAERFSI